MTPYGRTAAASGSIQEEVPLARQLLSNIHRFALHSGPKLTLQTKDKRLAIQKRRKDISVSGVRRHVYGIRLSGIHDRIYMYMIMLPGGITRTWMAAVVRTWVGLTA